MDILQFLAIVMVAGGIGGLVNSLILDKGLTLPHTVPKGDGTSLLLPGFIGNVLIGAVAAGVSWSLYSTPQQFALSINASSTLVALGGAVLVGMAGAGWLTNTLEKNVFRAIVAQAVAAPASPDVAQQILNANSTNAANLVQSIQTSTAPLSLPDTQAAPLLSPGTPASPTITEPTSGSSSR